MVYALTIITRYSTPGIDIKIACLQPLLHASYIPPRLFPVVGDCDGITMSDDVSKAKKHVTILYSIFAEHCSIVATVTIYSLSLALSEVTVKDITTA